jgi:hypothetical protein
MRGRLSFLYTHRLDKLLVKTAVAAARCIIYYQAHVNEREMHKYFVTKTQYGILLAKEFFETVSDFGRFISIRKEKYK